MTGKFIDFVEWVKENYPDVDLLAPQWEWAQTILSSGRRSGRSFLIKLLYEFDTAENK